MLSKCGVPRLFERPQTGEIAVIVHIGFPSINQADLQEFKTLATSAGADVIAEVTGTRAKPEAKYFIGTGKVDDILEAVQLHQADLVLVNHDISPSQERNLEKLLQCRVLDRTGLILDIFAQRAQSFEGKLQVELAQLQHLSTRLVRGWTHLERQKGGIGLRGPGETQLETDRRLLRERIKMIHKRLAKVRQQRNQSRQARKRAHLPVISLVGYTNAGKSTLFNALTQSDVYAADQLFATLDPTLRKVNLPHFGEAVIADTVGFIRHLPHDLVEAFRGTLEETQLSDLILHVIDASDEHRRDNIRAVDEVLHEINADEVSTLQVYNKIDAIHAEPGVDYDLTGVPKRAHVSAQTGEGMDILLRAIVEALFSDPVSCCLKLAPSEGAIRSKLHRIDAIVSEEFDDYGNSLLELKISRKALQQLFY